MIIKCDYCKREFDTQRERKQHQKDAHKERWIDYELRRLAQKVARESKAEQGEQR